MALKNKTSLSNSPATPKTRKKLPKSPEKVSPEDEDITQPSLRMSDDVVGLMRTSKQMVEISKRNALESPLLRLPGRIRFNIWELVTSNLDIEVSLRRRWVARNTYDKLRRALLLDQKTRNAISSATLSALRLPEVCLQIYADTSILAFSLNTFVEGWNSTKSNRRVLKEVWRTSILPLQRKAIKTVEPFANLTYAFYSGWYRAPMSRPLLGLRRGHFDWKKIMYQQGTVVYPGWERHTRKGMQVRVKRMARDALKKRREKKKRKLAEKDIIAETDMEVEGGQDREGETVPNENMETIQGQEMDTVKGLDTDMAQTTDHEANPAPEAAGPYPKLDGGGSENTTSPSKEEQTSRSGGELE
ncbi:hypothetical protein K505DRAFT_341424 [Melanomma pulvis-pyrius CBS 109.77]|uniref:Uncharacterized protein n=1 Tax=Melanomma pulvis-pyrius CBS 109.77 TaxID=1314802 RepID=A0A6A6WYT3_9PLEO|nr:hypothetical protein K505DRAFT_341424 [Melanomma pulvis-pyrius CBS 109.77]